MKCKICSRPLKNRESIKSGIGPTCAGKYQQLKFNRIKSEKNQINMFGTRARYDVQRHDNVIVLFDLGGMKSLTNDMENCLLEVVMEHPDLNECIIIYQDGEGNFDRVIGTNIGKPSQVVNFAVIKPRTIIKDLQTAIQEAKNLKA